MSQAASTTVDHARRTQHRRAGLLMAALAVASVDLAAKALAENHLIDTSVDLGVLQLQLAHNSGVAFSLGNALPAGLVVALTTALTAAMAWYGWRHAPRSGRVQLLAGGAIIGGALANVLDRAGDGVVTDYLHTGWWPTFNLADTFLVVGSISLVLLQKRTEHRARPLGNDPGSEDVRPNCVESR